jgi:FkbM family methyltransferase
MTPGRTKPGLKLTLLPALFRKCPSLPGKGRLARLLLGRSLDREGIRVDVSSSESFVVPHLRDPIAFHLLIDGVYEPETRDFILRHLSPGAVFVDVGANIGAFSVPAARKVGSSGRVVAVEASPRVFRFLEQNIRDNGLANVLLKGCAACDREGPVALYEAPACSSGMGALAPQFGVTPTPVQGRPLDDILEEEGMRQIDVLKVDVEGFETATFLGARRLLTGPHPPLVVFEFVDWAEARVPDCEIGDAQRQLAAWGYRLWRLRDYVRGKGPLQGIRTTGSEMLVAQRA